MKNVMIAFVILWTTTLWAQEPQKVYSFAKDHHELPWYQTQQKLWKEIIEKNNKNGEAWLNYYRASRAIRYMAPRQQDQENWDQSVFDKHNALCKKIATDVGIAMPESFEFYVISGAENQIGQSGEAYLKAAELRPFDPEILDELMIHYDMQFDSKNKDLYAKKLFETNDMPVGILNWGYNALAGLDENAILFTYGDNDTYGAWIVQSAMNHRKDVTVLNTYMLQVDDYRIKMFKKLGIDPLDIRFEGNKDAALHEEYFQKMMKHIAESDRPVYFTNSNLDFLKGNFDDQLYLTGLTMKYCENSFDNVAIIKRNFEKRYLLDYLTQLFSCNISDGASIWFNAMYLPAMIKLHQHYTESEDLAQKEKLEKLMLKVAEQSGKTEEVNKILGQ